ncbi:methyl-accepting chemotaxis protein [Salibacterium qingdaonense]|uniref:Methyl-accepting chemotaxis protein n=1 Tax=Salibacterium qingdaonense TaxID=266892 RepID=A0A1I4LQ43_9BACI|nr:methyl-accepting chemotaxis protein [Salibacterium qingdaonense]SFL93124.1 methyl-accepting chemotaxis protein [Salibacterium qingdaonense]
MSLKAKLLVYCLSLLVIPVAVLGWISYDTAKSELNAASEVSLENYVGMAAEMTDRMQQAAADGSMSEEQAREQVKESLLGPSQGGGERTVSGDIDLGPNGYFYIMDSEGTLLAHPNQEGDNIWDSQSDDGTYFIQETVEKAQNGGGFVNYEWPLPSNEDVSKPKIIYAEYDEEWDWVIAAGSYMMDYNEGASNVLSIMLFTLAGALVIGAVIVYFFARRISRPVEKLNEEVQRVASGDLSDRDLSIHRKDEIGSLAAQVDHMKTSLRSIIGSVNDSAQQVSAMSEELNATTDENAKAAEMMSQSVQEVNDQSYRQTAAAEESNQAMEEINTTVSDMRGRVDQTKRSTATAKGKTETGKEKISTLTTEVGELQQLTTRTNSEIQELEQKSGQITDIVSLITDISEQTNLLALNAAIEAARAGESGKGFAVVAEEVRKLAERSSASASDINRLIQEIQETVKRSAAAMNENHDKAANCNERAQETDATFDEIEEAVTSIASDVDAINHALGAIEEKTEASGSQIGDMQEISRQNAENVEQVASGIEEQNASMEEISASADNLSHVAESMQESIAAFRFEEENRSGKQENQ